VSIILRANDDQDLKINVWNWGVLHHLVSCGDIFSEEFWEPKRHNCGGELDADQIATLVGFLESDVLPRLQPGQRMFHDGSVTDEPDDGTFYRDEEEMWRNYSLHYSMLVKVIEFLRLAPPPIDVL
jgi:hypothetical protein